ncbi:MAG: hypothetical protein LBR08_02290 [Bacteroidales bacterium]|nr:hypothetical protein [Bacteroidales bacterium]
MESKVQEIAEKIYQEGVEKGRDEARKIIEQAEAEKADLLKKAKQEAEKIVTDARKQAEELAKNTKSELSLYAARMVETLKSEITRLIAGELVREAVKETVTGEWLQKLMLTLAKEWASRENIVIQTADAEMFGRYFAQHAERLLDNGVRIEQIDGKPAGFSIMPADGSYKVLFGEEEFAAFFMDLLRPQLVKLLFENV